MEFGFGFMEVGTVTPLPQPGNPRPRVFRLEEDRAVINRNGFNSFGADVVALSLDARAATIAAAHANYIPLTVAEIATGPIGINIGMNKLTTEPVKDYEIGIDKLATHSDFIVVNVSSPNTPGLRDLQKKSTLHTLLTAVKKRRDDQFRAAKQLNPPLFVKIAPDLTEADKQDIAEVREAGIRPSLFNEIRNAH
jgi:dihydroorotate dehydrogenase